MQNIFNTDLQFFADGGTAGNAAPTTAANAAAPTGADTSADAGQSRGSSLGIPPQMRERYGKRRSTGGGSSGSGGTGADGSGDGELPSFAELLKKPEYNRAVQDIVSKRLKNAKQAGDTLERLTPALRVLAQRYGMEYGGDFDAQAFCSAVTADIGSDGTGASDGTGGAGENSAAADESRERNASAGKRDMFHAHFTRLRREEAALRSLYPGFDLMRELDQNPVFARVTAPDVGMSVEDAFYATHHRELEQNTAHTVARRTSEALANSIRAGTARPAENSGAITAAPPGAVPYSRMTGTEREELRREIYSAGQKGRKLPLRG